LIRVDELFRVSAQKQLVHLGGRRCRVAVAQLRDRVAGREDQLAIEGIIGRCSARSANRRAGVVVAAAR
jgi:hypothetical protein